MSNNILVTGGCGFIGSSFTNMTLQNKKYDLVINLDSLTYAGDLENTSLFCKNPRYKFIHGNIENYELVSHLLREYNIKTVVNFAAESHVDNSIKSPNIFIKSNINGVLQLLRAAYNNWMVKPNVVKDGSENHMFFHVSTDEVYGTLTTESKESFTEESNYAPNSPYAASKASAEMIVRSFFQTHGMNTLITSCSNNYGERQNKEKLIPHTIHSILNNKKIHVHGNGKNIRDWLYVEDHCEAISLLLNYKHKKYGQKYNIGGGEELNNIAVVNHICSTLDRKIKSKTLNTYKELISFVQDRPGNDLKYSVNTSKLSSLTGWRPRVPFTAGLEKTIDWYIKAYKNN